MIDRKLPNGLRVLLQEDRTSCINIVLAVAAGSIHETSAPGCGCAHWVEHLLFDGCKDFPGDGVIKAVSRLGGSFNAMTGLFRTEYTLSVCPGDLAEALKIMGAMLSAPAFLPDQIEHERSVISREIDLYADDSEAALDELLYSSVYAGTLLAEPVAGRKELFSAAPADLPGKFFRRWYTPERMVLAITGPLNSEETLVLAEKYLGILCGNNEKFEYRLNFADKDTERRKVKKFPDPDTAKIAVGFPFTGTDRKEFWAGSILASLLAWNNSSFLEKELCRKQYLAREVSASLDGDGAWGVFRVEADCAPGKCSALEAELTNILSSFDTGVITPDAIEAEKLQCTAILRSEFRDPATLAGKMAERATLPEREISPDPLADAEIIREITPEDIKTFARKYLQPEHLSTVILAPDLRQTRKKKAVKTTPQNYTPAPVPEPLSTHAFLNSNSGTFPGKSIFVPDRSGITDITVLLPCAGSREAALCNGISQLACRVLEAGPWKYSEEEWLARLDAGAINLDADFTSSAMRLEISVPAENQDTAMEYLLELLDRPAWRREAVCREAIGLSEEWLSLSSTGAKIFDRARKLLFGDHPAGLPAGDSQKIHTVNSNMLNEFYRSLWIPAGVTVGFGGTYSPASAKSFLTALADMMPWTSGPLPGDSIWQKPQCDQYDEVPLDREQCLCVCMLPAPALAETKELAAFKILDYVEGGLSGRLFQLIREKHHLAYSVETGTVPGFGCGAMYFSAGCEFTDAEKVISLFDTELQNIADGNISREHFEQARAEERVTRLMHESNRISLCSRKTLTEFCGTGKLGSEIDAMTYTGFLDTVTGLIASAGKVTVKAIEAE